MNPEVILIPAAPEGDFVIYHVSHSHSPLYIDSDRGSRNIPEPASEFAESIVRDFELAQIERSTEENAGPGIFWVIGELTKKQIVEQHADKLLNARQRQTRWFGRLVRRADDDWTKLPQNNQISDLQRLAARTLKLDKPYLYDVNDMGNKSCPACGTIVTPDAAVCSNCKCILDEKRFKELKFATT